jgi:hypothetical protein
MAPRLEHLAHGPTARDPVPVSGPPGLSAATAIWRHGGVRYLTLAAKRSFSLAPGRDALPAAPAPVERSERWTDAGRFVCDELAPCLARGEVCVVGQAHGAPGTVAALALRLSRDGSALLDKRASAPADGHGRVSLAAFAPLPRSAPERASLLSSGPWFDDGELALPDDIDWAYFQAAPVDQRLAFVAPNDRVELELRYDRGVAVMSLTVPADLPGARLLESGREPEPLALHPDLVIVDADALVAHVVYRARAVLVGDARDARVEVDDAAIPAELAGTTTAVAGDTLAHLRAQALPFRPALPGALPKEALPELASQLPQSGSTQDCDPAEVQSLRAQFLPFERAPASGPVQASTAQRGLPSPPPLSASPEPLPVEPAPPPPAPPSSLAIASGGGGETLAVDPEDLEELRAKYATPFEKPTAKLARARGLPVPASKPAGPTAPAAASGETVTVDPEEVERLRALHGGPFSQRKPGGEGAPPSGGESPR